MIFEGVLTKMESEFSHPIQYYLVFETDFINMNQLLNKTITIKFIKYQCLECGLEKPLYRQGFCKSCFFHVPQTADWVMRPELSRAHLDIEERDLAFEKNVQLQPHIVYLANSSNVKVGVTRKSQIPTRWIDQGAHEAIEIVEVPNRYLAGITEAALKYHVSDKTNWRSMLKNDVKDEDLVSWRTRLEQFIPEEVKDYFITTNQETHLEFPVYKYPLNPKSLSLEKAQTYTGNLTGIKGQYLIFEDETVFNVRANEGMVVGISVTN
jgi:hypothetical protein